MGPLGWQETVFIFVLALLIFGPKKLPELGKTIAKALTEFRRTSSELKSTWDREMSSLERETESVREATASVQSELQEYTAPYTYEEGSYDYSYDSAASEPQGVDAPAPEGASQNADGAQDHGLSAAETAGNNGGPAIEATLAEGSEAASEAKPAAVAGEGLTPGSQPVAG